MAQDLEHIFTYHPPGPGDQDKYSRIRSAARSLAEMIQEEVPPGADQVAAIRKVREAVMVANAGIALKGRIHEEAPINRKGQMGQ